MTSLERVAVVFAGLYLGVALLAGIRSLAIGDAAYLAGFGVVMGAMGVVCVACFRDVPTVVYVRVALASAFGVLVAAGLVDLGRVFGEIGLVLLVGAGGLLAVQHRHGRRRPDEPSTLTPPHRRPRPQSVPDQHAAAIAGGPELGPVVPVDPGTVDLTIDDSMTDLDLCQAWRSSYVALERARSAASRDRIVLSRVVLLDELERRHPIELRAWLVSGARAAGGPERFVLGDGSGDQVVG